MLESANAGWMDAVEKLWPAIASISVGAATVFGLAVKRKIKDEERDEESKSLKELASALSSILARVITLETQMKSGDANCDRHTAEIKEIHGELKELGSRVGTNAGWIERIRGRFNFG